MPERSLKAWFKLAFHMLVSDQWDKVKEIAEDTDVTYRWLKEQILREVRGIEEKAFRSFLGSAALNIRDRLISLKNVKPDEDTFNKVKFWLKQQTGKMVLEDDDNSSEDRVTACKLALLEASFVYFDEPATVAIYFRFLLAKLADVGGVYSAIEDKDNPGLLAQVKAIDDAAKEYITSLGQDLGDEWPEFNITAEALPAEKADYKPPEIWCFGDYGMEDGQMSYPEKVAIDKEGQFLVLEENTIGVNVVTIQRIQLFSPKGKFLKCLLKRGEGKVNGMADMCLTKDGNILVADESGENNASRIQIFDYEGNQILKITPEVEPPENPPRFISVAVDPDGRIIAADISALCVCIFSTEGKIVCKFGGFGRKEGEFQSLSTVCCDNAGKIYVADSALKRIQVFDCSGNFLSVFGPSGTFLRYMLFDSAGGEVIGSDYENHKVKVYSPDGDPLREHGKFGMGLEDLWFPYGLALTADGKVAISERENHRITVLKI